MPPSPEDLLGSDVYRKATVTSASGGLHYILPYHRTKRNLIPKDKR